MPRQNSPPNMCELYFVQTVPSLWWQIQSPWWSPLLSPTRKVSSGWLHQFPTVVKSSFNQKSISIWEKLKISCFHIFKLCVINTQYPWKNYQLRQWNISSRTYSANQILPSVGIKISIINHVVCSITESWEIGIFNWSLISRQLIMNI